MDKRRNYILVIDTETANTLVGPRGGLDMSDVLVYDCGWAVVDKRGTVYETASYVNRDIFAYERELMSSAYYADKIPMYVADIKAGRRKMASFYEIRQAILNTIEKWNIKAVCAHNARFDHNALNRTQSWCSKARFRYFFPFGQDIEWWDTMKMAEDVIRPMASYQAFCNMNVGYTLKNGKPRLTAEILYRFISGNWEFEESHTGLEDVMIEKEILAYCFRRHKKMRKRLYEEPKIFSESTPFQAELMTNIKMNPVIRVAD